MPIDMLREERMPLDFFSTTRTKPSGGIPLKQRGHHALCVMREIWRKDKRVHKDALVHHIHVFVIERGKTGLDWI